MALSTWPRPLKSMKSRAVGLVLPLALQHAVADAVHARHALRAPPSVNGSSMPLAREVEVERLGQQRQRIDLERQLGDDRHLVLGLGLGRAADRHEDVADGDVVGIAAEPRRLVLDRLVALLAGLDVAGGGEDHLAPARRRSAGRGRWRRPG